MTVLNRETGKVGVGEKNIKMHVQVQAQQHVPKCSKSETRTWTLATNQLASNGQCNMGEEEWAPNLAMETGLFENSHHYLGAKTKHYC